MVNFAMVLFDLFLQCMLNHQLLCVGASVLAQKVSTFAQYMLNYSFVFNPLFVTKLS